MCTELETELLKLGFCCVALVVSDSVRPHRRQPTRLPVPGILQARTLEWVAISFSNAWKWKVKVKSLSRVQLLATPWTTAYQAPPSMGFSRQKYWSGVPLPSQAGGHPDTPENYHCYQRTKWLITRLFFIQLWILWTFPKCHPAVMLLTKILAILVTTSIYGTVTEL